MQQRHNFGIKLGALVIFIAFLLPTDPVLIAPAKAGSKSPAKVDSGLCMGPHSARRALIYLHGLEEAKGESEAEKTNRLVLERLSQKFDVRIALPQSAYRCAAGKRCWPGSQPEEVLKVYRELLTASQACWGSRVPEAHALLGFSNGGYYAFKLYKTHRDPRLKWIFASGSSGTWEPQSDKPNPLSRFYLTLGSKELTLPAARRFEDKFRRTKADFAIETFEGGHHLNEAALLRLLEKSGL